MVPQHLGGIGKEAGVCSQPQLHGEFKASLYISGDPVSTATTKAQGAEEIAGKYLYCKQQNPEFRSQSPEKVLDVVLCTCELVAGRQRQEDPCDFLPNQSSLFDEFRATERCQRRVTFEVVL